MRYTPAKISRYALYIFPVTIVAALVCMYLVRLPPGRPAIWVMRHRRKGRIELLWARRPRPVRWFFAHLRRRLV